MKLFRITCLKYCCVLAIVMLITYTVWSRLSSTPSRTRDYILSPHVLKTMSERRRQLTGNNSAQAAMRKTCVSVDSISAGKEGRPAEGFRLRSVHLLVRHGDRGPLLPVRNLSTIDCGLPPRLPATYRALYRSYGRAAAGRAATAAWRSRLDALSVHRLLPADGQCRLGRLTPLGALQLLRLGAVLRPRYAALLAEAGAARLAGYYTPLERTLQSGAALLFGLAGEAALTGASWQAARDTDLCLAHCGCAAARQLQTRAGLAARRRLAAHPAVAELVARCGPLAVQQPVAAPPLRPAELWDALLAPLCHGAPLPCAGAECVSTADAGSLLVFRQWEARQPRSDDLRRAARLRMRRFFEEVGRQLGRVAARDPTSPLLTVWAAHDTTLSAALLALDVRAMTAQFAPQYAARLVIEVHEPVAAGGARGWQFRALYNGESVTALLPMCAGAPEARLDLCPLQALLNFTGAGYMAPFDGQTYEQACADTSS